MSLSTIRNIDAAPLRRRFLFDLKVIRRTGHHPDGRPVGPVLAPKVNVIIASIEERLAASAFGRA